MPNHKKKLLFFVTEDWYFCSHRIDLARAAKQAGYQVSVLTRVTRHGDIIRNEGFELIPLQIERGGVNPLRELNTIYQIVKHYKKISPDIVHHVAIKPVIYGGLISIFMQKIKVVNLIAGFGAIFSSNNLKARILRPFVKIIFKRIFARKGSVVVVQNSEDRQLLLDELRVNPYSVSLIKGSGIDIDKFLPSKEPPGIVSIALVSRLLWDKGIKEFVEAVSVLKTKGLEFNAYLVGEPDDSNLASVHHSQLTEWEDNNIVKCIGFKKNIADFWMNNHIAVLPSYREGLPKSLLESAACSRPIVTTNTSGCKEVVKDGVNGFLVPVRNVELLAKALESLLLNPTLRIKMGEVGRERVIKEFSNEIIINETLGIYKKLME